MGEPDAVDRKTVLLGEKTIAGVEAYLPEYAIDRLWEQADALAYATERGANVVAIVTDGADVDPALVAALPALKLIACMASGYEGVDVAGARARGVEVTHGAGINHAEVADHVLAMLLAHNRSLIGGDRMVRDGQWGQSRRPTPRALKGLKVGVLGLGAIGAAVADRLVPFGCDIAWSGPRPKPEAPYPRHADVHELAEWCDVLIVTARTNADNIGLISKRIIESVGPQGLIVNVSRGSIIDEDALRAALRDGRLGGAALDVFIDEPTPPALWTDVPNTLLSPHAAGISDRTGPAMVAGVRANLTQVLAGAPPISPVP